MAGSGRSGTSLLAGLCARLGYDVPRPEVKANDSNPYGFGEPRWAVDFHNELLAAVAVGAEDGRPVAWQRVAEADQRAVWTARLTEWLAGQFETHHRLVVKDPRVSWWLPLYQEAAQSLGAELRLLTSLRPPAESVASRGLAYGESSTATTRTVGWLNMQLGTERLTRNETRGFVFYNDMLSDWEAELSRAFQGQILAAAAAEERAAAASLVDPGLRRAHATWDDLDVSPRISDLADRTYQALGRMARDESDPAFTALDQLWDEFTAIYTEAEEIATSSIRAVRMARRAAAAAERSAPPPPTTLRRIAGKVRRTLAP